MNILNLTQHDATSDQVAGGVVEPTDKVRVRELLTFEELPDREQVRARADALTAMAAQGGYEAVMIGGAPLFMAPLELALKEMGIKPLYSFTRRESAERSDGQGGVTKTQVFRHVGFYEA